MSVDLEMVAMMPKMPSIKLDPSLLVVAQEKSSVSVLFLLTILL
jgi:hypothetical protein